MTSPITAQACSAWWILEAADMRGLPVPFVVKAYANRVEASVYPEDFDRWAEALGGDVKESDAFGATMRTVTGELNDSGQPVTVSTLVRVGAPA